MKRSSFFDSRVMQASLVCLASMVALTHSGEVVMRSQAFGQTPPPPPPPPPMPDGSDADSAPPDMPVPDEVSDAGSSYDGGSSSSSGSSNFSPKDVPAAPSKNIRAGKESVSIDFPEPTELKDIIKAVGLWSGKNFILNKNISAKITIISPQLVTKEEAWQAFLSALNIAGFTTVESGKFTKIVPTNVAPGSNIKTYYSKSWAPATDETITQIIPLEFMQAGDLANNIKNTLKISSNITAFPSTNSLIVTDTGHKVRRILEVIRILDIKGNQPQLAIEPVKNTDANDIKTKIESLFAKSGGTSPYLQKVIVDTRSNSLLLVGPPKGLDDVVRVIRRLDKPSEDLSGQAQIHIRPLEYADAEKLSATLSSLATGARSSAVPRRMPSIPGSNSGTPSVANIGDVKITADKPTNSLIIQGSKSAYDELDTLIKNLDKRRNQVYIEVDILDINVDNSLDVGTGLLGGGTADNGRALLPFAWRPARVAPFAFSPANATQLPNIPNDAVLGILGGKAIKIGGIELSPGAFIKALKTDSNANVLQTPNLLVADNEEANFSATEREYYQDVTQDTATKIESKKWQNADAVLELQIKPQISKSDFVNLDINIKAERFDIRVDPSAPPNKNVRQTKTKITAGNQQTIVISGLSRDKETESKSKVPLLGDIPILGWLFRDTQKVKQKTNLTIFITPYVVRDASDLSKIYEKKTRERDEFIKAFYGSMKNSQVFSRMPNEERGKVPAGLLSKETESTQGNIPIIPATPAGGAGGKTGLPSEEADPVVVPVGTGGSSSSAPMYNDMGGYDPSATPPPPPPPPSMPSTSEEAP
jgi:general secretion pathway protein D